MSIFPPDVRRSVLLQTGKGGVYWTRKAIWHKLVTHFVTSGEPMRRRVPVVMILVLGLILVLGFGLFAQVKKDQKTGQDRLDGKILTMDKAKAALTLEQSSAATKTTWHVVYNEKTKFTTHSKPAKMDDLKEGKRVIVLGKFNQNVMTASQIDIR
jgi:hypothetical protein